MTDDAPLGKAIVSQMTRAVKLMSGSRSTSGRRIPGAGFQPLAKTPGSNTEPARRSCNASVPKMGGMVTSTVPTLIVIPVLFAPVVEQNWGVCVPIQPKESVSAQLASEHRHD
jgi:hypothetical protein